MNISNHAIKPSKLAANSRALLASVESLLNCYFREVAQPNRTWGIEQPISTNNLPNEIRTQINNQSVQALLIDLSCLQCQLCVAASLCSTGHHRYFSRVFFRAQATEKWLPIELFPLAELLFDELSHLLKRPKNKQLLEQLENSIQLISLILEQPRLGIKAPRIIRDFIQAEQALTFGHAFHPAPKAREGFSDRENKQFSPEVGAAFQLVYFKVKQPFVICRGEIASEIVVDDHMTLVPVHPWQAKWLLKNKSVQQSLDNGDMEYLGAQGALFYASSSVRTVYSPECAYSYKLSLHVRLTNCIRKNAVYELENAVLITKLIEPACQDLAQHFPHLSMMSEPGFVSVDLPDANDDDRKKITEAMGVIFRENKTLFADETITVQVAAALFSEDENQTSRISALLKQVSEHQNASYQTVAVRWFSEFVNQFLPPVFYLYFYHGVVVEPHMQNMLLGLRHDQCVRIYIRDREGTKLVTDIWEDKIPDQTSTIQSAALCYDAKQGFNRLVYCSLINVCAEAIAQIAQTDKILVQKLWQVVASTLSDYQDKYGSDTSAPIIKQLLTGQAWPAKCNLLVRFNQAADKDAVYVDFPNPLASL